MPERIVARFTVTGFEPVPLQGIEGDWVGAVIMRKRFTAGLIGESTAHFVASGSEETGRGYLAAERITGTLDDGRGGAFTVHHGALQHPDDPSAFGYLIPGSGTGDFSGFSGSARIHHDSDGAFFVIELD